MIDPTHLLFGLALAYLLDFPVVYGMVGAVFPDIDVLFEFAFPFTHRGILHTPLAIIVIIGVLYLLTDRRDASLGFGLGHLSHLFLDTFTFSGIMWLYPLTTSYSLELVTYDSFLVNIGTAVLSVAAMLGFRYRHEVRIWMR